MNFLLRPRYNVLKLLSVSFSLIKCINLVMAAKVKHLLGPLIKSCNFPFTTFIYLTRRLYGHALRKENISK